MMRSNHPMFNDLKAKERRLLHKALQEREEEREPFRFTTTQTFHNLIFIRIVVSSPNMKLVQVWCTPLLHNIIQILNNVLRD